MVDPATCPVQLFENFSWALNERNTRLYAELLSPGFMFVDETAGTSTTGKEREEDVINRIFRTYRTIYFVCTATFARRPTMGAWSCAAWFKCA